MELTKTINKEIVGLLDLFPFKPQKIFKHNEILFPQESKCNDVFLIVKGFCKEIRITGKKNYCITRISKEGEFPDINSVLHIHKHTRTVRAFGKATICIISREVFMKKYRSNSFLRIAILQQLSSEINELEAQDYKYPITPRHKI